ncbi:hypothetical protein NFI96_007085, partial [Prochilodus magdalenae]
WYLPVLTVEPNRPQIFSGETVTLTCSVPGQRVDDWTYYWYRDNTQLHHSDQNYYTITDIRVSQSSKYKCYGLMKRGNGYCDWSNAVTITVTERPKASLTMVPTGQMFSGETVTLRCDIQGHTDTGWSYSWYKDGDSNRPVHSSGYKTDYSFSAVESDSGTYTCRGERRRDSQRSDISNTVTLTVSALPRATLTVEPGWNPLFTGESVTLKCETQSYSNWRYQWYKGSSGTAVNQSQTHTFTIRSADQDQYWCRGERDNRPTSSQNSNKVSLSVAERPKPELTSSHKGAALIGNPVVLYCKLDPSAGWKFYWSKHTQNPENETETETPSYTFSSVSVSDGGQYWCRAGRGDPVYYTHYSDALQINTTGESPPVSLMVSPSRTQHFTTDSLSLSCEGQSDSTAWTVRRYTHSEKVSDCSSGWGSATGSTCSISSLYTFHTGVYWCESESGGSSNPVNITVHNGSVILESPVHPVPEGDSLTLHCLYHHTNSSNLTAEFYKNGSLLQTTGEMTIRTVSKSDEGLYQCKDPERGESPQSWISVRAGKSTAGLVGVVGGASVAVLSIILLPLLCCYKAKKGNQQNISQTQNQRESGAEDSQSGCTPLQAGDAADELNDVIYSEVVVKNKRSKDKGQDITEQSSQGHVIYSNLPLDKATGRYVPVLTVEPNGPQIFSGETVTLTCSIPGQRVDDWRYYWYRDNTQLHHSDQNYYTITDIRVSQSSDYYCYGLVKRGQEVCDWSNAVTLTVTERPKASLTMVPTGQMFSGETVTLRCDIQGHTDTGWSYSWYKDGDSNRPVHSSSYKTDYSFSAVESDSGTYTCRGERRRDSQRSEISNTVTLTVSGESPPVSLMVSPSRTQHFTTDSLSLSCEGQSDSTGWRVRRYTHSEEVSDCSSGWGSVTGSTCNISSLSPSHTGVYWCESESGENSNPLNITVHNNVILESPVYPVPEGGPLTLHCSYRHTKPSNLTAEFYKDGSLLQTQTPGEMTICTVSKSDEGNLQNINQTSDSG